MASPKTPDANDERESESSADPAAAPAAVALTPEVRQRVDRFVRGEITLAEVAGLDGKGLTRLADIGRWLLDAGKLVEARAMFEGLLALTPNAPYPLLALGALAQREERWEAAAGYYGKSLERDDKNAVAWANHGEVLLMMGRLPEAAQALMRCVELDAHAREPQTRRSIALLAELQKQLKRSGA